MRTLMHRSQGRTGSAIATCVAVVVVVFLLAGRSAVIDQTLILALINLVMVLGLFIFVGCSGVASFGHVSFMAIGAYVCGMLTIPDIAKGVLIPNAPAIFRDLTPGTTEAVIIGAVVAAILAALLAQPLMRLNGIAASIGTLAILVIVFTFFDNWQPGTGGGGTLTRIPADLSVNAMVVWALIALVSAFAYKASRFGLRLRAAREDELAARAIGIAVRRERTIAFVISAFLFGAAGGLYAHALGSFSADDFYLQVTFLTLAMLVVGGSASVSGAVLGTGLLSFVAYVLDTWTRGDTSFGLSIDVPDGARDLVIALVMVVVLLVRPDGLTAGKEFGVPRLRRPHRRPGSAQHESRASDGQPTPKAARP